MPTTVRATPLELAGCEEGDEKPRRDGKPGRYEK